MLINKRQIHTTLFCSSILLLELISFFVLKQKASFSLFENNTKENIKRRPSTYRENDSDTASFASLERKNNMYEFTFSKTDKIDNNYAACYFPLEDLPIYLDDYTEIVVHAKFTKAKLVPLNLSLHYDDERVRYITNMIEVKPGIETYRIQINEFKTPPSWFRINKSVLDSLPLVTLKNAKTLSVSSCHLIDPFVKETYLIYSISFEKDTSHWLWIFLGSNIILLFGWAVFYLKIFSSKKEFIHIPVKPIKVKKQESELQNILGYISRNYQNPELTVGNISKSLIVNKSEIPKLIKNEMKLSFPQYLSKIRVEEAKRLFLTNENKSISEVGYLVGFNSPSNFNRVFKAIEGCTPKEFKEHNQLKTNTLKKL